MRISSMACTRMKVSSSLPVKVGAGKTTIVRGMLENLDQEKVIAAHLVSTQLDARTTHCVSSAPHLVSVPKMSRSQTS